MRCGLTSTAARKGGGTAWACSFPRECCPGIRCTCRPCVGGRREGGEGKRLLAREGGIVDTAGRGGVLLMMRGRSGRVEWRDRGLNQGAGNDQAS